MPSPYVTLTNLPSEREGPLQSVRVSLKDCFDLAGFPTSAGSRFYLDQGTKTEDSTVAKLLKQSGAFIVGKTQMHQLAYGITGENADFGDMTQPLHPERLTGGSSSGAAASVQDGSAFAAIGTDTGGSIRVPAALCGLCGYRSSLSLNTPELWAGGAHLAPSFDTLGWLYPRPHDGPRLARVLFQAVEPAPPVHAKGLRIGVPDAAFLHDAEAAVMRNLETTLTKFGSDGAVIDRFDSSPWDDALSIYSPIVAFEAANIHHGHFRHFEPAIAARLEAGAHTTYEQAAILYAALEAFRANFAQLWRRFDYLLFPVAPMTQLIAGEDQTHNRSCILRYTTPVSLAGCPAVTLPSGLQLIAPDAGDAALLALSATL